MLKPFRLIPEYRDYIWGGNRLRPEAEITAEAWVIYEFDQIADGPFAGETLAALTQKHPDLLLGKKAVQQTGNRFPLLVKLLDCAQWLSIQVHPNDAQAVALEGPGNFGKTEAWYVIDAEEDARLVSGFCAGTTQADIERTIGTKAMLDIVANRAVQPGDSLLITPGTIHALGPGLLIYEVQQTSNITYRVYDWDRPQTGGRQLHLEQAAAVLNPAATGEVVPRPLPTSNGQQPLVTSQYFGLDVVNWHANGVMIDLKGKTFSAITALTNDVMLNGTDWQIELNSFESAIIPACSGAFRVQVHQNGTALHAFIP